MRQKDESVTITEQTLHTILHNARKAISYYYYIFRINGRKHFLVGILVNMYNGTELLFFLAMKICKIMQKFILNKNAIKH